MPSSFFHDHKSNLLPCSSSANRDLTKINNVIKNKINQGKTVLDAVEETIIHEDINVVASKGKKSFYQAAWKHASRSNLLRPEIPLLKRDKPVFENFNEVRTCLNDPFNDGLKFAIRPGSENPSNFLPDNQIDRDFVICQTKEQRKLMEDCTVLNIDQNDTCTPEGCFRTLTISGKYKGKMIFFTFCSIFPHDFPVKMNVSLLRFVAKTKIGDFL